MVKNENHSGTSHTPDNSGPKPSPGHPTEKTATPQSSGADEFNTVTGPALTSGVSESPPSAIFEVLQGHRHAASASFNRTRGSISPRQRGCALTAG